MLNTVALMGRLTYDPELKTTPSGVSVLRFQLACDRTYQKAGAERQADFIDCVAWRQTAEFINRYFHKGSMIAVEGSIQTQNYTDRDGNKRKSVEVMANNVSFCGSRENASQTASEDVTESYEEIIDGDDLPF
ncbi:MAG: single-stranded DNA-binding protein [Eubacterium sp.]|nr:single-stranded DNA-binding protein [Eubacterium sp.]